MPAGIACWRDQFSHHNAFMVSVPALIACLCFAAAAFQTKIR